MPESDILTTLPWVTGAMVLLLLWKTFKNYLVKSPLDIVPGPPSISMTKGA